jgi:hypothetical protein
MLNTVTTVVVALLGVHIIVKFAFFGLPYRKRREALDKSYGNKPSATSLSDVIALGFTVVLSGLLLWRGVEAVSFLGGLWIGATLIQLYFHRFHEPVPADRAAPPETSRSRKCRMRFRRRRGGRGRRCWCWPPSSCGALS